jgi:AraC family transcriptional regulator
LSPERSYVPVTSDRSVLARSAGGLVLTEAKYSAGRRLPPHAHANAVMAFVLNGTVHERFGNRWEACGPMSLVPIPAGQQHSETFSAPETRALIIEVDTDRAESIRPFSRLLDHHGPIRGNAIEALGLDIYQEFRSGDATAPLAIEGLFLQLAAQALRGRSTIEAGSEPRWLRPVKDAIRSNFTKPIRLADLAAIARIHPVYLARAFRKHCGCSPAGYVRKLRIEAVRNALADTEMPLSKIALSTGFADQSHLTRHFQRVMGVSPGRYRAELHPRRSPATRSDS